MGDELVPFVGPEVYSQEPESIPYVISTTTESALELNSFPSDIPSSVGQWPFHTQQSTTITQTEDLMTQAENMDSIFLSLNPPLAQPISPPVITQVPLYHESYYVPRQKQQPSFQQIDNWDCHDPTLSPISQDLNPSDFDSPATPLLNSSSQSTPFLHSEPTDVAVNDMSVYLKGFTDYSFLIQYSAPPPLTPATTLAATPIIATPPMQLSPSPMLHINPHPAAPSSASFCIPSPTSNPLSPPLIPLSSSIPSMIPSNLFQLGYTPELSSSITMTNTSSSSTISRSSSKTKSRKHTRRSPNSYSFASGALDTSTNTPTLISSIKTQDECGNRRFRCAWKDCTQEFERNHNCKAHYTTHLGERPFKCEYSGCQSRGFRQKGDLTRHIRIHTNERPYECSGRSLGCSDAFSRCDQKTKHEKKCIYLGGN
ncbi:hypothetical protein FBU30_002190 [Linnemannia zychae]|nr:hypothetical protein FBU30_002190 [Linnemannia zychae]